MRIASVLFLLLVIANWSLFYCAEEVLEVISKIYGNKTVRNGLIKYYGTNTFKSVPNFEPSINIHVASSVFAHYQMTLQLSSTKTDFYSQLQKNAINVGSIVHSGNQSYKTATGFYMADLKPGTYNIKVLYKSPVTVYVYGELGYQTAILQVVYVEYGEAVSQSISCLALQYKICSSNTWGPLEGHKATLNLPTDRLILSAYQFSVVPFSQSYFVTALEVDGFHQHTTSFLKGNSSYLDIHGAWTGNAHKGLHYFTSQYRTPNWFAFRDCKIAI